MLCSQAGCRGAPPIEAIRTTWSPSRMKSSGVLRSSPLFAPDRLEHAHLLAHADAHSAARERQQHAVDSHRDVDVEPRAGLRPGESLTGRSDPAQLAVGVPFRWPSAQPIGSRDARRSRAARPVSRPGLGRRVLRRSRRLAGAAVGDRRHCRMPSRCERQPGRRLCDLARRRTRCWARARLAAADFTGGEPEGIAFGANMTTLNFQLAHAVARTLAAGRRDRRDGARPRRERLTLAAGGRRSRPRRAHRAAPGRGHDARHRCARGR